MLMDIQEKTGISVAKDHGVTTAKKFNKMKSKYGNDYTISVDKSGKVTKKKKNKSESRKKGMSLRKARRKAHTSGADRNLTKTKKSSLYKRLYGGKNEEINMEELIKYDPSDDISALFDGEDLSEEFKTKATTILEAAVTSNVKKILDEMVEEETEETEEQKDVQEEKTDDISDQVDKYLNYVVEEWMEENKLSVEQGIRYELSEQFITGLKTLFKESYIDIPEEKVDVVSELTTQVEKLQDDLNEERKFAVDLKETLQKFTKESIVSEITEKLVDTESVKIKELSEGIEFVSEEDYKEKVESLKESYFPSTKKVLTEENEVDEEPVQQVSGAMGVYTSTLDRIL